MVSNNFSSYAPIITPSLNPLRFGGLHFWKVVKKENHWWSVSGGGAGVLPSELFEPVVQRVVLIQPASHAALVVLEDLTRMEGVLAAPCFKLLIELKRWCAEFEHAVQSTSPRRLLLPPVLST